MAQVGGGGLEGRGWNGGVVLGVAILDGDIESDAPLFGPVGYPSSSCSSAVASPLFDDGAGGA